MRSPFNRQDIVKGICQQNPKKLKVLNPMTKIKICRITENANVPTRSTLESAGLDLSSAEDC